MPTTRIAFANALELAVTVLYSGNPSAGRREEFVGATGLDPVLVENRRARRPAMTRARCWPPCAARRNTGDRPQRRTRNGVATASSRPLGERGSNLLGKTGFQARTIQAAGASMSSRPEPPMPTPGEGPSSLDVATPPTRRPPEGRPGAAWARHAGVHASRLRPRATGDAARSRRRLQERLFGGRSGKTESTGR